MRIIAGDYKGRRLEGPLDDRVRPTGDKVTEAIFSIIMNHLDGSICCDLFSGTGNLGLEALSRGCDKCYFMDESSNSIKTTWNNIKICKADEYSVVLQGDSIKNLHRIRDKIDIFLIDPPYGFGLEEKAIEKIDELNLLNEGGVIVVEHKKGIRLPEKIEKFSRIKERRYGSVELSIYM